MHVFVTRSQPSRLARAARLGQARSMAVPATVGRVIEAEQDGPNVSIRVAGTLDEVAGIALVDTVRAELDRGPARVDVDLSGVGAFDEAGAAALVELRALGAGLPDGLHYRTEGGAGQDAVLAAFELEAIEGEPG